MLSVLRGQSGRGSVTGKPHPARPRLGRAFGRCVAYHAFEGIVLEQALVTGDGREAHRAQGVQRPIGIDIGQIDHIRAQILQGKVGLIVGRFGKHRFDHAVQQGRGG